MPELHKMDALWAYCIRGAAWFQRLNRQQVNDPVLIRLLEMGLVDGQAPDNKFNFPDRYAAIATSRLLDRLLVLERQKSLLDLEVRQQASHMRDGFSRVDADLVALDRRVSRRREEGDQVVDRLQALERTVESLVELNTEKDRQIEELQVQVQGMEGRLCRCGEMRQEEEEVERELHDDLPALESTDEELEYADAMESEYHTPPVVKSPTLQLIEPELNAFGTTSLPCEECPRPGVGWPGVEVSLTTTPRENEVPLPIRVSHSELVNPSEGQRAVRSLGPIRSPPTVFHLRHPYKPSGSLGPRWEPSIAQLVKRSSWREWARVPGNRYASVLTGRAPSESPSTSDRSERGDLGSGNADDDEDLGTGRG
jgi:hypothetical protein